MKNARPVKRFSLFHTTCNHNFLMNPFSSPLFWCMITAFAGGVVAGAVFSLTWAAPRWLIDG